MATSLVTETVSIWQILLNAGLCSKLQDMCIASPHHTLRLVNKELAVLLLQHLTGALLWMPSTERVPSNSTSAALSRPQELAEFHAKLRGKSGPTALWVLSSGSNTAGPSWGNTFGPVASPRPHASPSDTAPTSSSSPWQRLTQPAHIQQGRGNSSRLWSSQEAAISSCNFLARYLAHAANYMRLGSIVSLHLDFGGGGGVQGGVELQPAHLALLTQALRHSLRHLSVTTSGADPPTGWDVLAGVTSIRSLAIDWADPGSAHTLDEPLCERRTRQRKELWLIHSLQHLKDSLHVLSLPRVRLFPAALRALSRNSPSLRVLKVGRVGWSGPSNGVGPGHATGSDSDSDGEENGQLAWADGVLGGGQHWHGPDAHAEAHHAVHGDVPGGAAGDGEDSELDDAVLGCMPHLHTLCSSGWPMPAIDTALSIPAAGDSDVWAACASTGASAVAAASVNPAAAAAPADGCWPMDSNSSGDASSSSSSSRGQANSSRLHQQLDEYVCVHAHAADAYRWGLPGLPRLLRAMPALHTLCGVWLALEWPAAGQSEGMPQLHQAEAPGQGFAPPFPVHGMMTMDAAALHGDVPGAHWGVAVEEAAAAEQLLGRLAGSGGCWGLELVLPTRPPVVTAAAGAGAAHVDYMHLDLDDHPHNHMPLFNGAGASQQQQQQLNTQPLHAHEHGIVHRSRRPLHALMYLPQVQHLSVALDVDSLLTPFIAQELAVTFPNVHSLRLEYATAGLRSMHLITHALSQLKTLWLDLSGHLSLPLSLSHSSLPSVTPTAAAAAGMAAGSGVATAGLSSSIGASAWTHGSSGGASHAVEDWVLKLVAGLVAMCVRHSALACVHVHGLGEAALHAVTSALDACGEQCVVRPWHKEP